MWRTSVVAFALGSVVAVATTYASREAQSSEEEREAAHAREKGYEILRNSITSYKKRTDPSEQSFEHFLSIEWPQDYAQYKGGHRDYYEWKEMYDGT